MCSFRINDEFVAFELVITKGDEIMVKFIVYLCSYRLQLMTLDSRLPGFRLQHRNLNLNLPHQSSFFNMSTRCKVPIFINLISCSLNRSAVFVRFVPILLGSQHHSFMLLQKVG